MTRCCRRAFLFGLAALPVAANSDPLPQMEIQIFDAINFQRVSDGSEPLDWNPLLCLTARAHSGRMLTGKFFSHQDPLLGDLASRLGRAGVTWSLCGENILREKDYPDPVPIAVVSWMYSPGHRQNILNPDYRTTGVGIAIGNDGTVAVTQQFLRANS